VGNNFREYFRIFDLASDTVLDSKRNLYASGKHLPQFFDRIVRLLRRDYNMTMQEIAQSLKISYKQLRAWRKGRAPIPLNILKYITRKLNIDKRIVENKIDELSSSKGSKIKIPLHISAKLINVLGRFCGDGSCGVYGGKTYKFSLKERSRNFVELHAKDMEELFGVRGKVVTYHNFSENVIYSKPLVLLFCNIFQYHTDFTKTYDVKIPEFIKKTVWNKRVNFTRGLIETEGTFYYNKSTKSIVFEIKMRNKHLIEEVKEAFENFQIPYNYYSMNNIFRIRCYGKNTINLIRNIIQPKNERLLNQLKNIFKNYGA